MKSKLKKSLSLLLALVMCLSVMSVGAFAQGESHTVTFLLTDTVGKMQLPSRDSSVYTDVTGVWNNGVNDLSNQIIAFTQTVASGETATKPTKVPRYQINITQPNNGTHTTFTEEMRNAYTFDGWATEDGKLYDFTKPVTADLTLHPRFSATGATITISNEEQLLKFADEVKLGRIFCLDDEFRSQVTEPRQTVQLAGNITLESVWTPIASTFSGIFDGNHKTISGLNINSTENDVGFFKSTGSAAAVKDLTFAAPTVSSAGAYVGVLAGTATKNTQVSNVDVTGAFSVSGKENVGALFGRANASVNIEKCDITGTSATVTANGDDGRPVGGLLGDTNGAVSVTDCSVSGVTVTGHRKIGGLIGQQNGGALTCTNASVSNVTLHTNATTSYDNTLTMGGLVGIFAGSYSGSSITGGAVSDVTMTGPANIAEGKNYIMGLVSGGTGEARETAETNMTNAGMTFDVTVSGTNTRTRETVSNYAGIMGTAVQTTTYVGYVKSLGANVGNTIYLNVKMVFTNPQAGMRLKYQIGDLAPTYFDLPTPDSSNVSLFQIPVIAKYFGVQGTISLVDSNDETVYYISKGVNGEHVPSVQYSVYDYLDLLEKSNVAADWLDLSTAIRNLGNMTARHWRDDHNEDMANQTWRNYSATN